MSTDPRDDEAGERPEGVDPAAQEQATAAGPSSGSGGPGTDVPAAAGPLPDPPRDVREPDADPARGTGTPPGSGRAEGGTPPGDERSADVASDSVGSHHPAPAARDSEPTVVASSVDQDTGYDDDEALRAERARRFGQFGRSRTDDDAQVRTTALPTTGTDEAEIGGTTTVLPEGGSGTSAQDADQIDESDPFEDWDQPPRSRAQAHWWVVLITLVFIPPAWYLIADGGERWFNARDVAPEAIHVGALAEILGGLVLLAAVLIAARWSSVGPIIVGSIATLIGGAFLAIPQIVEEFLLDYSHIFTQLGQFGQNVYDHLLADGNTGRILAYGVVLIFVGVISHGARRQGRREERRRAAVEAL